MATLDRSSDDEFRRRYNIKRREFVFGTVLPVAHQNIQDYARIQETMPVHCVDIFACDPKGLILLGKRTAEPARGLLWPPGGRKWRNERLGACAARHFLKDTGLDIEQSRFAWLDGG